MSVTCLKRKQIVSVLLANSIDLFSIAAAFVLYSYAIIIIDCPTEFVTGFERILPCNILGFYPHSTTGVLSVRGCTENKIDMSR